MRMAFLGRQALRDVFFLIRCMADLQQNFMASYENAVAKSSGGVLSRFSGLLSSACEWTREWVYLLVTGAAVMGYDLLIFTHTTLNSEILINDRQRFIIFTSLSPRPISFKRMYKSMQKQRAVFPFPSFPFPDARTLCKVV